MPTERDDEQLQKHVQDELRRALALDVSDIGVTVERGVVAFDGHVPSAAQQQKAGEIARQVPGVRGIVDNLVIRARGTPLHEAIRLAREALDTLDRTALAGRERIQIIVHDGRVRLEGTVGSVAEKEAAEAAVGDVVLGWGAVENAILVQVQPEAPAGRNASRNTAAPGRDDDFDTLRIDPGPGGSEGSMPPKVPRGESTQPT